MSRKQLTREKRWILARSRRISRKFTWWNSEASGILKHPEDLHTRLCSQDFRRQLKKIHTSSLLRVLVNLFLMLSAEPCSPTRKHPPYGPRNTRGNVTLKLRESPDNAQCSIGTWFARSWRHVRNVFRDQGCIGAFYIPWITSKFTHFICANIPCICHFAHLRVSVQEGVVSLKLEASIEEVSRILSNLKNHKAAGEGGSSGDELLEMGLPILTQYNPK